MIKPRGEIGKWLNEPLWKPAPPNHPEGKFELVNDLQFFDGRHNLWTVPAGFVSDFNSIPGIGRLFYRIDVSLRAPWLHDYIYRYQPKGITKVGADRLYFESMLAEGVPEKKARRLHWFVYHFSGPLWTKRSKELDIYVDDIEG